jgi:broad specificity phosphatase PhoE
MGNIYLVRHGQASLGAENYDHLSPLGMKQTKLLGEYFKECETVFEATYVGTLIRQQQTLHQILMGMEQTELESSSVSALNEYDSQALIETVHSGPLPNPSSEQGYKHFFTLLRTALKAWMQGITLPKGMPSFREFAHHLELTMQRIQSAHTGNVLVVSSGGPIATVLSSLLQSSDEARIEMNLRLRNSSISQLYFTPKRISALSFNSVEHLAKPLYKDWITYA